MIVKHWLTAVTSLGLLIMALSIEAQEYITIGTGSISGVYYPTGTAICKIINKDRKQHHIRCSAEATLGSIYNLNAIQDGDLDFAIVQSDTQSQHSNSAKQSQKKQLMTMFSLHNEVFSVVARTDANINHLEDLAGKRVNIGGIGSGDRATMQVVMDAMGWSEKSFQLVSGLKVEERPKALCDNKLDAFIYIVGHPNTSIKEALSGCDTKLIPIEGDTINAIVKNNPYYTHTTLPADLYQTNQQSINSFSVLATLVTTSDLPVETAYLITKSLFSNFSTLKELHPALLSLEKQQMTGSATFAPIHPGAKKYFDEVGLFQSELRGDE